jgi:serpin B
LGIAVASATTTPVALISATPTATLGNCGVTGVTPAQADNMLAGNLYSYFQTQSGNVFYSPFSIFAAMSMAQEGANGTTGCQMQTALNLNSSASVRQAAMQSFINGINSPTKQFTLNVADNLWVQQGFNVLSSYVNDLQTYYSAGVTNVDFVGNPAAALQTIDGAVSQETAGYIPQLLTPANITPKTRVVLTNAIYFKASWQYQFPVTNTTLQNFYLDSGTSESVSMMNFTVSLPIGSFNGAASVIAIPYAGFDASMYVFLPPQEGITALGNLMTGANISSWLTANAASMGASTMANVSLSLPKFTFSTNYDLTAPLANLGMPLAFNPYLANFSGIDGSYDLSISDVVHQAYVDVSEVGTTAAAATGVVGCSDCEAVMMPIIIPFNVNRPFIFMIVDNVTNAVLFMGRVTNPI